MSSRFASAFILLVGACVANAAFANCAPLIAAFEKAGQVPRVARIAVWGPDPLVSRKSMHPSIDQTAQVLDARAEATGDLLLTALRTTPSMGGARCDAPIRDKIRGVATNRIRVVNPMATGEASELTVWVATASGLPGYHEIKVPERHGFAWV